MEFSENIANLAEGLAKFQATVIDPQKTSEAKVVMKGGGSYSFKYAGLDAIVKAVRAGLAEQGISFTQFPINNGNQVGVITMLMHSSGEWMRTDPFYVPVVKQDAQGFGSCITYAKRYSLAAVLGVSADEDDDANVGCGNKAEIQQKGALPAGIAPGAQNAAWVDDIRHKLADTCKAKDMDMKFISKVMQVKYGKDKSKLTVGDYTDMLNNFDSIVAECQEKAMALMEKAS